MGPAHEPCHSDKMRVIGVIVCLLCVFTSGVHGQSTRAAQLILISIDGFRWDYLELYETPNLDRIASRGVHVERLKAAFPTKTFPNHYTVVTGRYPADHGIISNNIWDPDLPDRFSLGNRDAVSDGRWWGAEPIWVTAERQGVRAATYFWPGSEAEILDTRPTLWKVYDGSISDSARVDEVLGWFDRPVAEQFGFMTLYFSDVDSKGHRFGPNSEEVRDAVVAVDIQVGRLLDGLAERGLTDHVDLIVTTDHGMAETTSERVVILEDYIDPSLLDIIDLYPALMANVVEGADTRALVNALHLAHPALKVWLRDDVPQRLAFEGHKRIPAIVGLVEEGWVIQPTRAQAYQQRNWINGGTHGYDPDALTMMGLFVAQGPSFKSGYHIEQLANTELYAMMCEILGITPAVNEGDPMIYRELLAD